MGSRSYLHLHVHKASLTNDQFRRVCLAWPGIDEASIDSVIKMRRKYEDYCLQGGVTHMWEIAWQLTGFAEIIRMMFTKPDEVDKILEGLHKLE